VGKDGSLAERGRVKSLPGSRKAPIPYEGCWERAGLNIGKVIPGSRKRKSRRRLTGRKGIGKGGKPISFFISPKALKLYFHPSKVPEWGGGGEKKRRWDDVDAFVESSKARHDVVREQAVPIFS